MSKKNRLAKRLQNGDTLWGVCTMYPAPGIIEGMSPGWDYVWIDGQHGEYDYQTILQGVWVAGGMDMDTVVRVPTHDPGLLGVYADLAPSALMVPMVNTPEQARSIVDALRFPPHGNRSYGGRRIIDLHGPNAYRESQMLIVAQIETVEAVENAPEIAATNGIDVLFFGPDDMRCQMDIPIGTPVMENERLKEAMKSTATAALDAGKTCGSVATVPDVAAAFHEAGYRMLVGGSDIGFLRGGAPSQLARLREAVTSQEVAPGQKSKAGSFYN